MSEKEFQNILDYKFRLPIEHLEDTKTVPLSLARDLELTDISNNLYNYLLSNHNTVFGDKTKLLWTNSYSANKNYIEDTQTLLSKSLKPFDSSFNDMKNLWNDIHIETGFHEKYHFIEWDYFKQLNYSAVFMQGASLYNMSSPFFSLTLPIFFLIVPFFMLRLQGKSVSVSEYYSVLKMIIEKHQIGQLFSISSATWDKRIYIIISLVLYLFQIYQNISACIRFYNNMTYIHKQIFTVRDFANDTIERIDDYIINSKKLKTYKKFVKTIVYHRDILESIRDELSCITPYKFNLAKINNIGYIMSCFYQIYQCPHIRDTLEFSILFQGYCDNISSIQYNIKSKSIQYCKIKKNSPCKFTEAYFPSIKHTKPIKNTYTLDKNILITGPNAAGKTTLLKTTLYNILLSQQIGCGYFKKAVINPYDYIHCYINIPDTSGRDSLFQAEARRCKDILDEICNNSNKRHFCIFDELYSGTNPYEAVASAYAYLKYLNNNKNVTYIITTHYLDLCKNLEDDENNKNYNMKILGSKNNLTYTYKLTEGISNIRGGTKVLYDLEYPEEILCNTNKFLDEKNY